jgi:hypothetical protein
MELEFNVWNLHYAKCKALGETFLSLGGGKNQENKGYYTCSLRVTKILHLVMDLMPKIGIRSLPP